MSETTARREHEGRGITPPLRRRALIAGGVGALLGCSADREQPDWAASGASAPPLAARLGYTKLLFEDDFDDPSTLATPSAAAQNARWFTQLPFGWGVTPSSDVTIADSVLTIRQSISNLNWAVSTLDPVKRRGHRFKHGFFLARIRFSPAPTDSPDGWPSVWLFSSRHTERNLSLPAGERAHWGELDIFEFGKDEEGNYINNSIHDWLPGRDRVNYGYNKTHTDADFSEWHEVGVCWSPGQAIWTFDGRETRRQGWGTQGPTPRPSGVWSREDFQILDRDADGMILVLGGGVGWPVEVDWVRIWGA